MATFGDTNNEASNNQFSSGDRVLGKFTLTEAGSVTQVSAYLSGGASAQVARAIIYTDNAGHPANFQAVSAEVSVGAGQAAGWVNFTVSTSLTAGTYWLGLWFGLTTGGINFFRGAGTGVSADAAGSYSQTLNPANFAGDGTDVNAGTWLYSIYATYTATGGGSSSAPNLIILSGNRW